MSEVQSGTSKSGYKWERMTLCLEIPGFQGSVYKQVFQVTGDHIKDVLLYNIGDHVQVGFSLYAREWNGRWYNNVDLISITSPTGAVKSEPANERSNEETSLDPAENPEDLPF